MDGQTGSSSSPGPAEEHRGRPTAPAQAGAPMGTLEGLRLFPPGAPGPGRSPLGPVVGPQEQRPPCPCPGVKLLTLFMNRLPVSELDDCAQRLICLLSPSTLPSGTGPSRLGLRSEC